MRKLSKEENTRIKLRTEERLDVAKGKMNLWKKFEMGREKGEIAEDELEAWEDVQRLVME